MKSISKSFLRYVKDCTK